MEVISNGPVYVLSGSEADQARTLGRLSVADIEANVAFVHAERRKVVARGMSNEEYDRLLSQNEEYVRSVSPETIEQIAALAEGSGIPYRDMLELNLLMFFPLRRVVSECSQFFVGQSQTVKGHQILAKSRDFDEPVLRQSVIVRNYNDGTQIVELIHSGAVTSVGSGINTAGVTLGTSGVWARSFNYEPANAGKSWNMANLHLVLREAATVDDVERLLNATSRNTGFNIIAADGKSAATFEMTCDHVIRTDDTEGRLVLTNHYVNAELKAQSPTREEYPSTFDRSEFLTSFDSGKKLDAERVWAAMTSHVGYPQSSLCRHAINDPVHQSTTNCASVAILPEKIFMVAIGQPCEAVLRFGPEPDGSSK